MSKYKLHPTGKLILEFLGGDSIRYIPVEDTDSYYQAYQKWREDPANVPDPADPPPSDPFAGSDAAARDAFMLGWVLGQARLVGNGPLSIKTQMTDIATHMDEVGAVASPSTLNLSALTAVLNQVKKVAADVKVQSKAIDDMAEQLAKTKRAVAIQAGVPDR